LGPIWRAVRAGAIEIVSSELVFLETLVKPIRDRDGLLENLYRALLLDSREVRLVPVSLSILERAARIRAVAGLKTPDSIHAATALDVRAALFITNDAQMRRVGDLKVAVLSEV
jgi:predicted nucleic acid-binding protein